ncbi:hypothetical protein, partial [Pseudomonas aeruginosa]|uniref:hypothetical protein n=1 Tax=Pseudomonas aeruginosa TaxID=287 RepID=UPI0031B6C39D
MPIDARMYPLEEAEYLALLVAQSEGKQIVADAAGRPFCIDPPGANGKRQISASIATNRDKSRHA